METDKILRRYTTLPVLIDMLVRERITILGYGHWVDANDRHALELYQQALHYGFVGAMCLTMAPETFHHWQIFAQGESGVCVVFDRERLEKHLAGRSHFIPRKVEYVQLSEIGSVDATDIHRLPFLKRFGFRDEREYRLLGFAPEKRDSMSIPLTPDLIQRVTFSPATHPDVVASLKSQICESACRGWPIYRSCRSRRSRLRQPGRAFRRCRQSDRPFGFASPRPRIILCRHRSEPGLSSRNCLRSRRRACRSSPTPMSWIGLSRAATTRENAMPNAASARTR